MLNESVIKVLKNEMWDLATCANGEPNVVPVAFKDVTEEGKLVDSFKEMVEKMFQGAATAKGALVITPSKVIVTTPGADNKKEI
ncbi:hypothetical protein DXB96_07940 [Clostridium sp. OM07-10AC]|uniref:hypothetical protein n=1 Tax=Jutongia sp. TaxID=2944204 RepID=UPI000E4793A7|nr:hypothetical protein DXC08_04705 [Clostridium sp. OM07-9AC]RHV04538.1 hypothetical protein DXB96_07940 [Clostridium sp. OM07-10AC]